MNGKELKAEIERLKKELATTMIENIKSQNRESDLRIEKKEWERRFDLLLEKFP